MRYVTRALGAARMVMTVVGFVGVRGQRITTELGTGPLTASSESGASYTEASSPPTGIIVMAQARSGSTMLGELFRQNQEVLYWYEPCLSTLHRKMLRGQECLDLVHRIIKCNFTMEDAKGFQTDPYMKWRGSPILHLFHGSLSLEQAHQQMLTNCKNRRAVVVKEVRLLDGIGSEDELGPKTLVLHLVRDPRAVARSQLEALKNVKVDGNDRVSKAGSAGLMVCTRYKNQLESAAKLTTHRHLRLRYEDLSTAPEVAVNLVYSWSGLSPVPSSVVSWIDKNTKLPGCEDETRRLDADAEYIRQLAFQKPAGVEGRAPTVSTDNATFSVGTGEGDRHKRVICAQNTRMERNHFSTKRDSATMVSMWRTQMPEDEQMAVWEACKASGVMSEFGYDL